MDNFESVETKENNTFEVLTAGHYVILIAARASAWWQNFPQFLKRFFQDDNLSVTLDNYPTELKWNGNDLKGLEQTNIFLARLKPGLHKFNFKQTQPPTITKTEIYKVQNDAPDLTEILPEKIEDGDRRPLLKLAIIDTKQKKILVKAVVISGRQHRLFQKDDDDLKLIIDGETMENNSPKSHKNWYWCGRAQALINTPEKSLERNLLVKNLVLLEFYADRMPKIRSLKFFFDNTSPAFDKLLIMSDGEFTEMAMTREEIEIFLKEKAGNHSDHIAFKIFAGETVAGLSFEACKANFINPKVILAKLQTEQGLVEGVNAANPTKQQIDGAMGVGVFDDGTVDRKYQGFSIQIISAAETFRENFDVATGANFKLDNVDGHELIVKNGATFSLYRYTPHISGAKLFFDIYHSFFNNV
ncbi:hypothetical protein HY085_01400 [Candidatus Gottesmanbacteria bacterium]|nr:hypothetical protein [Candidatus Gottesmanbacteria bacterium]